MNGNWKTDKKDVNLASFYPIKDEYYEAQGLIFRMERIILPTNLQQKILKVAHRIGHKNDKDKTDAESKVLVS